VAEHRVQTELVVDRPRSVECVFETDSLRCE